MSNITIGVDISKLKFDVYFKDDKQKAHHRSFDNNQQGFEEFLQYLPQAENFTLGMEATGRYGENLACYCYNQGMEIFVLNPATVKHYTKAMMLRVKTDKVDAKAICEFIDHKKDQLHCWKPKSNELRQLQALSQYQDNLKSDRIKLLSRTEAICAGDTKNLQPVLSIVYEHLNIIDELIAKIQLQINELLSKSQELQDKIALLNTIPGVGNCTAIGVIANIPDVNAFKNSKQLVGYAGLNPSIKESGSSVRGRSAISKTGSKRLRKVLYMPAMSALRYNPILRDFAKRLEESGKNGKAIIVALMRKLLSMIYGILKSGKPFDAKIVS